ncbi:MAG TPA: hypothetical protein EYN39_09465 [Deltaproteobacteria bacterium]|nr:hypothetical protein [Deltaproteobacteria bacterium]
MNWLKRTLGICTMSVCLLFGGVTNASAETLQTVFINSLWGSAIGGVSGLAFWALQDEDKEDKLFPKYVIKGLALGLFVGMGVGIYESRTESGIFMSDGKLKGLFHFDLNSKILVIRPAKLLPQPEIDLNTDSPQWRLDLLTASF